MHRRLPILASVGVVVFLSHALPALSAQVAPAREALIGVTRANIRQQDGGGPTESFASKTGLVLGGAMRVTGGTRAAVMAQVHFVQKGARDSQAGETSTLSVDYVGLGVFSRYALGGSGGVRTHLMAGPILNVMVGCRIAENDERRVGCDEAFGPGQGLKGFDVGATVGLGVAVDRATLHIRYEHGLANIAEEDGNTIRNSTVSIALGITL